MAKIYTTPIKIKIPPHEQEQILAFCEAFYDANKRVFGKGVIEHIENKKDDVLWHPSSTKELLKNNKDNYMYLSIDVDDARTLDALCPLFGVRPTTLFYAGIVSLMSSQNQPLLRQRKTPTQ